MQEITDNQLRYTIPSKYDLAPFGTRCNIMIDDNQIQQYIQITQTPDTAEWIRLGNFFEMIFAELSNDPEFIQSCTNFYRHKNKDKFLEDINSLYITLKVEKSISTS
jgi:hypothetical protein